ncbi:MAG: hypothetical protein JWL90_3549 [Chthoniobacteraceae bacterium]|nr:hypothetical protein [Chthoniobacteraceae bacterium]MDB6171310.1 hypothetical protein [Chthoniobacteraceae bacterium]
MKPLLITALIAMALPAFGADSKDGWTSLFDGKTLDGWKISEKPGTFSVKDGEIVVRGDRSHLFYDGPVLNHNFKNFELKTDVMTRKGANSGVYFHTEFQETGFPNKGYEVQVNNTHTDPKKTAGLYGIQDNFTAPAKDDEWFTLTIKVEGKHIVTKVNDKVISDYTEEATPKREGQFLKRLVSSGTFALQGHDPASEVHFKNIEVKPLP